MQLPRLPRWIAEPESREPLEPVHPDSSLVLRVLRLEAARPPERRLPETENEALLLDRSNRAGHVCLGGKWLIQVAADVGLW